MTVGSVSTDETLPGEDTLESSRPGGPRGPSLERGSSVGRYVLIEHVGRGGMGIVHAAYDPQLDRKVALKVLIPRVDEHADEAGRKRLIREAQAMAQLRHPNVVAVYDVGVHEGRVFVAMEFVDGVTLGRWLEAATRSTQEVLEVFVQAGRGLAAAHAKGMVHRDFKPENVMVGRADGDAEVRAQVMDFGLVRGMVDEDAPPPTDDGEPTPARDEALTHAGQLMGTPSFMAPEQFLHAEVDARTDQFAFCVALWEAMAEAHPFGGGGLGELVGRVVAGELDEPPAGSRLEPWLRRILERGLSVQQSERWPSMDALLAELRRDRSRRRRRWVLGVGAVMMVGAGLGAQQLLHGRAVRACEAEAASIDEVWNEASQRRVRAGLLATELPRAEATYQRLVPWVERHVGSWREAMEHACLSTKVDQRWDEARAEASLACLDERRRDVHRLLERLEVADVELLDSAVTVAADLDPPARCIDERLMAYQFAAPRDPATRAEHDAIHELLSKVSFLRDESRLDEATAILDELEPRVRALGPGEVALRTLHMDANVESDARRLDAAEVRYHEAFVMALELGATEKAAGLALERAGLQLARGKHLEGRRQAETAAALYRSMGEPDDGLRMLDVMRLLVWLDHELGDLDRALETASRVLAVGEAQLGADHPRRADDLCLMAMVEGTASRLQSAEEHARRCLERHEAALGLEHPKVIHALQQLGEVLRMQGRLPEAVDALERALVVAQKVFPERNHRLGTVMGNLGLTLNDSGRLDEAEAMLDEGLEILEATLGREHTEVGQTLVNLGNVRQNRGDHDGAIETYRRAMGIIETNYGPKHRSLAIVLANLANSELFVERYDDAVAHQLQAIEILEGSLGPEHPVVGQVLGNLGEAYRQQQRYEDALAVLERALSIYEGAGGPSSDAAAVQWAVARALTAVGREPKRARELAEQAVVVLEAAGDPLADEVRRWLDGEPPEAAEP